MMTTVSSSTIMTAQPVLTGGKPEYPGRLPRIGDLSDDVIAWQDGASLSKDWEDLRRHAINTARQRRVPEDLVEDAAQYVCERLWIDGDWDCADSTAIWNKVTDWIRMEIGRYGPNKKPSVLWNESPSLDWEGEDGERYQPDEIGQVDSYPCHTYVPEIKRMKNMRHESVDKYNFVIACVAFGIPQVEIGKCLGITEAAICHILKACGRQIDREDLLP